MRIIYIITQGECGGAQKNVLDQAIFMKNCGHAVYVITGKQDSDKDAWLFNELMKWGFTDKQLIIENTLEREIECTNDTKAFFSFYKKFHELKPHIIHAHSTKAGIIACIAGKFYGAKVFYTVHGFVFSEPLSVVKRRFYIAIEYIASLFRDFTITVSNYDREIGLRYKVIKDKNSTVVYNGIDFEKRKLLFQKKIARDFVVSKLEIPFDSTHRLVGTVANLYKTKGLGYLIEAASILKKTKNFKCSFVVIGQGELKNELEKKIHDLDVQDCFSLFGSLDDAYRYLKAFDLIVLPSVKEGFPYILIESLLAEVPFIATNVGGIPELSNFVHTRLVPPENPVRLADEIYSFFTEKISEYANLLPKQFSLRYMSATTLSLYERFINQSCVHNHEETSFLITLPAFNEEAIIENTILKVTEYLHEKFNDLLDKKQIALCVAINGSTDKTLDIVTKLEKKISFLTHSITATKGRGLALSTTWSNSSQDILIYMDADLAYSLNDLGAIINSYINNENFDLVVASRRLQDSYVKRHFVRSFLTSGYNIFLKCLFLNSFTDAQAGCKSIRRSVYDSIHSEIRNHTGWFFDSALLLYSEKRNFKIKDIPITCIDQRKWRLKIIGTVIYFVCNALILRIKTLFRSF